LLYRHVARKLGTQRPIRGGGKWSPVWANGNNRQENYFLITNISYKYENSYTCRKYLLLNVYSVTEYDAKKKKKKTILFRASVYFFSQKGIWNSEERQPFSLLHFPSFSIPFSLLRYKTMLRPWKKETVFS
jgi:hypothetical protein